MEVEMLEDDVFFAELSKRISLLITDDDDEQFPAAAMPVVVPLGFPHVVVPPGLFVHHASRYGTAGGGGDRQAWQQCGSKGTGVFIPRSSPAASKKKGRKWSGGGGGGSNAAAARGKVEAAGVPPTKSRS